MSLKNLNGVHIPHRKNTAGLQAVKMPPPATVTIPLSMHIGRPANCVVAVGDHVDVGQLIAEPGGFVSSPVYASVSGTVKKIEPMLQFMGATCQAVVIESDGAMTPANVTPPEITDYDSFIKAVRDSGVVGLGGATFPTAVKLDVKDTSRIQEIIINGAECEGYITSDHRTMLDRTDEVVAEIPVFDTQTLSDVTSLLYSKTSGLMTISTKDGVDWTLSGADASVVQAAVKYVGTELYIDTSLLPKGSYTLSLVRGKDKLELRLKMGWK